MKNPFTIFSVSSNTFEGKHDDETVLLYLHRHWYTLIGKFIYVFLASLIPFILIALAGPWIVKYHLSLLVVFIFSAYYMVLWYVLGYTLTMYVMDIWIVTNMRIVDSTQQGFFSRTVSEVSLGNVQDVSTMISGAIPTMFNYGDVEIQSAGAVEHFKFKQVPNPQHIKEIISKALADYKKTHFKDEALEVVREVEEARDKLEKKEDTTPDNLPS